ncbi:uncharacterized protein LOC132747267 [Ruditapes philippinarum]|uniref:uncharacterized protein LOC132747267 n=1 Tax=Ruditapes philippinarum TaxID=129788 RepID=UPI00295BE314|nr:uncharacterized protein LOC132747267 [Ruditapes philippinarum]
MASNINDKAPETENVDHLDPEILEHIQTCVSNPRRYEKLQVIVKEMIQNPGDWFQHYSTLQVKPHPCLAEYSIEPIGSSSEQLAITEVSEAGYNEELDFTLVLKTITATHDTMKCNSKNMAKVTYSTEFPGHVYLNIQDSDTASTWNNFCNIISNEKGNINEFYIAPEGISDEFYMMICYRNTTQNWIHFRKYLTMDENVRQTLIESYGVGVNTKNNEAKSVEDSYFMTTQEGPAIKTSFFFKSDKASLQFDCAMAIHCLEWPTVAEEWIERKRKSGWPSESSVRNITSNGCLIVPKCPLSSKTHLEWRISFCLVERELMKQLKDEQKQCYILLKGIWRQFLKPPSGKALQSYHLKNVLLWECENIDDDDWTLRNIVTRVKGLLVRLKSYIDDAHCPHYIVPANNLFQDIEDDVLHRTGERIEVCLLQANVTWIQNSALFSLSPEKTRLGMRRDMLDAYIEFVEEICKSYVNFETKSSFVKFSILHAILEKVSLKDLVGSLGLEFIMKMMELAMRLNEGSLMRRYMCTRASPIQLQQAAKDGMLDFVASNVSALMILSELTEVVTKIEILKTQNFQEYGFPKGYASDEILRTLGTFMQQCAIDNGTDFEYYQVFENIDVLKEILKESIVKENANEDSEYEEVEEIVCDNCGEDILETHYHCTVCEDFDLCKTCFESRHGHEHEFILTNM